MRELSKETISGGRAKTASFEDLALTDCVFDDLVLLPQKTPGHWSSIHNVHTSNATQINCIIKTAKVENCTLHNLKRGGRHPLFFWGCVFNQVTISGKISGLKINRLVDTNDLDRSAQPAWDRAMKEFYANVDWALDISAAEFAGSVSFEAIPGAKIRRNPETQALVTREALGRKDWQQLDYGHSAFDICLRWFLEGSLFDSVILAARMGSRDAKNDVAVLQMLKDQGIAC